MSDRMVRFDSLATTALFLDRAGDPWKKVGPGLATNGGRWWEVPPDEWVGVRVPDAVVPRADLPGLVELVKDVQRELRELRREVAGLRNAHPGAFFGGA